jgi:Flp pilus assembly protein TadD
MLFAQSLRAMAHRATQSVQRACDSEARAEELVVRARRLRQRGELRRALLVLREACHLEEANAARWMSYGALAADAGRRDEAEQAMKHALWLRERQRDTKKAVVIRRILLKLATIPHD